jgi:hypothetical protein
MNMYHGTKLDLLSHFVYSHNPQKSDYSNFGIGNTNFVGPLSKNLVIPHSKMLTIKCPKAKDSSSNDTIIDPKNYWEEVQTQLECIPLENIPIKTKKNRNFYSFTKNRIIKSLSYKKKDKLKNKLLGKFEKTIETTGQWPPPK